MKSFFFKALIAFPLLIAGGGCGDDKTADDQPPVEDPVIKLEAGASTQTSISLLISATDAEQMAYLIQEKSDEIVAATAEDIFKDGIILNASTEPLTINKGELTPGVEYYVEAAARSKNRYSEPQTLTLTTQEIPQLIYFESATKTGFTYRIANIADDQIFFHTYLEKWQYDNLYADYQEGYGEEFDIDLMLTNFLADYGYESTGPQTITWDGSDEHPQIGGIAAIIGGIEYYAIACPFDMENMVWGKPESVLFKTEDPAESSAKFEITIEELTPTGVLARMASKDPIKYFFYTLFDKPYADALKEGLGQKGFENHVYELGDIAEYDYTNRWNFSAPIAKQYVLTIVAVDENGDMLYAEKVIDVPDVQADFVLSMQPYENELQGYFDYQSIEVAVAPSYFGDASFGEVVWAFSPKAVIDDTVEMMGSASIEECVATGAIPMSLLTPEWEESLTAKGSFTTYFDDLDPETEYCFIIAAPDPNNSEKIVVRYATATTKAVPDTSNPDPEYLACLGSWKLTGQSTEDWSSPLTYDLTVEQLTPNRSVKVKGWAKSNIGQDFPFVMNYDPATKKFSVKAPQSLGTYTQDEIDLEVIFVGLFVNGLTDDLSIYMAPTYTAFTGRINGNQMNFFSEIFKYEGQDKEFKSMGYVGRAADGQFYTFTGDEYNPIYFSIEKSTANAVPAQPRRAGIGGKCNFVSNWFAPQPQHKVQIPLRPAAMQSQAIESTSPHKRIFVAK